MNELYDLFSKLTIAEMLAIFSLIIALIGGIPGIIKIINNFKEQNKLIWTQFNFIVGDMVNADDKSVKKFIVFIGLITNRGKKPIYSLHYSMFLKNKCKWHELEKILIPDKIVFESNVQNINIEKPWEKDLQKSSQQLIESKPNFGLLMFIFTESSFSYFSKLDKPKFKIVCSDSIDNKHRFKFKIIKKLELNKNMMYPHVGLSISPK